ncbi:MAG TPA: hypothetical protein PLM07_12885 [Candidatus Rifleibacterium sp.]|nr:hypothetical protein [Candidatus Rifleibacterium sp.]HPT46779.1 hypothetical protein [Candidatus Rifleibacterium sp.]
MTKKLFVGFLMMFFVVALSGALQAATYGYVIVKGKDEKSLDRETAAIEMLIKNWDKGEMLFKHKISSGFVFFKKHTITMFFAGLEKDVTQFLSRSSYEGDFLKDIVVQLNYTSYSSPREVGPSLATMVTKTHSNIRKALGEIEGKTDNSLWKTLSTANPKAYKSHLVDGKLLYPQINVTFYSLKATEENRLFSLSFGEGYYRDIK